MTTGSRPPGEPAEDRSTADVTRDRGGLLLFYGLPVLAVALAPNWLAGRWLGLAWAVAFGVMGGRCVANARRCGRTHCYLTGPWFLAAAVASLLQGLAVLPWGLQAWGWIANVTLLGALVLFVAPERLLGRYRGRGR